MRVVLSVVLALFLFGCSDDSSVKDELLKQVEKTSDLVVKNTNEVVQKVKAVSAEVVDQVKESSTKVVDGVAKTTSKVTQKIEKKVTTTTASSGAQLFKKCAGCHGLHGEKKALGKSQVIKGWDVETTLIAIEGYKDGSYGHSMKGVMKSQVSKFSDAELEKIAKYISKL